MIVRCPGDYSFGPTLDGGPNCYNFDFTLVFEDYFFSIAPCGVTLLFAIWRFYLLTKRQDLVHWPIARALKLVTTLLPIDIAERHLTL